MILPLPECPVGHIIGSTHNVWQEGVFIFFFFSSGRRWEEGFVGVGVVTVATVSNHTVIIHRRKYTRPRYCLLCSKTNISPPSLLPPAWVSICPLLGAGCWGEGRRLRLTLWSPCPPFPQPGGWGYRGKKIRWRMLLLPSGPAVLFPCSALKLLKLTYYLLDWANMFVFWCACVCVCVSGCSAPFSPPSF